MLLVVVTYRTECRLDVSQGIARHRVSVAAISITRTLLLSELILESRMHVTGYSAYPVLWLIGEDGQKYKIGEFYGQDVERFATELAEFSGLTYRASHAAN